MKKTINCFVPFASKQQAEATVASLKESDLVSKIFFLIQVKKVVKTLFYPCKSEFFLNFCSGRPIF